MTSPEFNRDVCLMIRSRSEGHRKGHLIFRHSYYHCEQTIENKSSAQLQQDYISMYSISSTGQTTQTYWLKIRQTPNKRTWMCILSAPRLVTFDIIELMLHVQQSRPSLIFPVGQSKPPYKIEGCQTNEESHR